MEMQCRLCLKTFHNMKNIMLHPSTPDYELSIPESINIFFSIKIEKNDNYSKLVCSNCLSLIQLMHMHRKKFQESQKHLRPIVKLEKNNIEQNDDDIPVLNAYFLASKATSSEENRESPTSCLQNDRHKHSESEFIKIPKAYFEHDLNCPRIVINAKERLLANSALYGHNYEWKCEKRRKKMKKKYLRHVYNEGRPGVIRELIQCQAKKNLYISEFDDNDNKLRSIYEYDINLRPRTKDYDEELWKLNLQLNVQVCNLCSEVFYSQIALNRHQEAHRSFQIKTELWKMIL